MDHRSVSISLLGPPQVMVDGVPLQTDRRKAIGLLAYLAAELGRHTRDELSALLWPDYPQASAFSYLRRTLWELNQALGKGWVEANRQEAWLERRSGLRIDLDEFRRLAAAPGEKIDSLIEAARLYRGEWMHGFMIADTAPFEQWQLAQAEHWRAEITRLLERLVTSLEKIHDYAQVLPHAQRWRELDRLDEAAWRAVMRTQLGMDDRNAAIRTYQACVQTLQEELGIAPQEETQQLFQSILKGDTPVQLPAAMETPARLAEFVVSLPTPGTTFIGRREEIEQLGVLLRNEDIRLITLLGVGGTGKTRLSIRAAAERECCFADGIWFIPLAAVQNSDGLVTAIAKGLGFSFYLGEESPRQQLLDYLRNKHMLLVLDNFEQLVSEGRALLQDILESACQVSMLVTSRERLNLQAEQVYQVGGLKIPDERAIYQYDYAAAQTETFSALQLFSERARRARPDFQFSPNNLPQIVRICRLVDGSPLGIELAAAWLEVLSPEEIAREIERSLDFLESEAEDLPERQRSLRAVFETSWKLLQPGERQAFQRLCVFRGSFSRPAAESVGDCSLKTMLGLVHKSWLHQVEDGRFEVHEVLRQYGRQALLADLPDWKETRTRHAEFFASFVHLQGQALQTSMQVQALDKLKPEMESNIPEAWDWLAETGRVDVIVEKMLPSLFHYWMIRSSSLDLRSMYHKALDATGTSTSRQAMVQRAILETVLLNLEMGGEDYSEHPKERTRELLDKVSQLKLEAEMGIFFSLLLTSYGMYVNFEEGSLRFAALVPGIDSVQNPWELGYAYLQASQMCGMENHDLVQKYLSKALEAFTRIGVLHEKGITLQMLGVLAANQMEYARAIEYNLSAQRYYQQVGGMWDENHTWLSLADDYIYSGEIEQAFHAYEQSREFTEKSGNRRLLGLVLSWESLAVSRFGSLDRALELRQQSRAIAFEVGNQNDIAWHTWELGEIYRLKGDLNLAMRYFDQAHPLFEVLKDELGLGFYHRGYGDIAITHQDWMTAKREFELALEHQQKEVRHFTTWGLILYHSRLGMVLSRLGEIESAAGHIRSALALVPSWPYPDVKGLITLGIASLLLAKGEAEMAMEAATCTIHQPTTWNEVKQQGSAFLEEARLSLSTEQATEAQQWGETKTIDQLIQRYSNNPMLG